MGYPEDLLAPEEKLLLHRHQHWKALIMPSVWLVLYTAAAIWLAVWLGGGDGWLADNAWMIIGGIWLVLFVWLAVAPFIRWSTTHFVITDRRILFRTGVFTRSGIDIPVARINSVQFEHDLIDRFFQTGTLIVESASDDPLEFADIPQVEKVHAMLYNELYDELHDQDDR